MGTRFVSNFAATVGVLVGVLVAAACERNQAVTASPPAAPSRADSEQPAQAASSPANDALAASTSGSSTLATTGTDGSKPEAAGSEPEPKPELDPTSGAHERGRSKRDEGGGEPKPKPKKASTAGDARRGRDAPARRTSARAESKALLASGRSVFKSKCRACHGADGRAETKLGRKFEIEPWDRSGWTQQWSLERVVRTVTEGIPDTKMRSFAGKLSPEEIRAVSVYARSLGG